MTVRNQSKDSNLSGRLFLLRAVLAGYWAQFVNSWRLFRTQKVGMVGLIFIIIFAVMAFVHPILINTVWPSHIYDPIIGLDPEVITFPAPPSSTHWLGVDPFGRDVLSQLLYSTRNEFILGIIAALVTLIVATAVGAVAAYYPGIIDATLMRVADIVIMLPALSFLILLGSLLELDFWSLALIIGVLTGFGSAALILKSQALTIKVKPYIDAAKVSGASGPRIVFSHIVPNLLPLAFLFMMFTVTGAIFSEAVLSFFGVIEVRMSWGVMLNITQTQGYLTDFARWWLVLPASVSITLLCGSFYLVGRGLDPIVNPKLRKR